MEKAQDNRQVATEALTSVIGAAPNKRLTISDLGQVIGRLLPFGTDFAEHFGCGRLHDFLKDNTHFAVDGYGAKNNKVVRLTKIGRVLKAHHVSWPLVLPLRQEIPMKVPPSGSDLDDEEEHEDQWNVVKGVRSMKGSKGDKVSAPLDPDLALEELLLRHMRNSNPHLGYSLDQVAVPLVQHARMNPKHMSLREWLKLRREMFVLRESNVCLHKKYIDFERGLRADLVSIMRHLNRPAHMRHDLHRFCNLTDVAMTVMKLASFLRSNPHVFRLEHGWVFLSDQCCRAAPPLNTVEEAIECLRTGLPPQHHSFKQDYSADENGTVPASQGVWANAVAKHGGKPDSRRGSYQGGQLMHDPVAQLEQDIVSLLLREGAQTTNDIATFVFMQHESLVPVQWDASSYAANNKQLFTVNGDLVDLTPSARKQYGSPLGEALAELGEAAYEGTAEQTGRAGSIAEQAVASAGDGPPYAVHPAGGHAEADVNGDAYSDTTGAEGQQGFQDGAPASGKDSAPAQQASADASPQNHGSDVQWPWVSPQHTAPLRPPTHERLEQQERLKQQLQQPPTQSPQTAVPPGHHQGSPTGLSPSARHQPPVPVQALPPTVSLGNFQPGGGFVLSEAAQRATPATLMGVDMAELMSLRMELRTGMKTMQSLETQNQALRRRCANLEDEVQTLRVGLAEVRQHILLKQQPQQHQHQQQQPQLPATPANARQEPIQRAPSRSNKIYICGGCSEASWQWGALSCTPSSGEWETLPDMPGIHAFGASVSVGQTVYVMGGSTTGSQEDWSASVISCDTAAPSSWVIRAPMQVARGSLAAAVLHNTIYTMGGGAGQQHLSVCERYDVMADQWVACPAMLSRRWALAVATLQDCIFAVGGVDGDRCLNTTERFDPREGRWQMMDSPMRHARGNFACATLSSQLYAIGGTGTDAVMADVEVLDIRKMQWQSVAPLSAPRTFGSAVALDNTIFAVGGFQSCLKDLRPVLEAYQPSTNKWSLLNTDHASPPAKRAFFTACVA